MDLIKSLNQGGPEKELTIQISEYFQMSFSFYREDLPNFQSDEEIVAFAKKYVLDNFETEVSARLKQLQNGVFKVVSFRGTGLFD